MAGVTGCASSTGNHVRRRPVTAARPRSEAQFVRFMQAVLSLVLARRRENCRFAGCSDACTAHYDLRLMRLVPSPGGRCFRQNGAAHSVTMRHVVGPPDDRLRGARSLGLVGLAACAIALASPPHARASQSRYCQKPGGPGNFLAASPGVSCATARKVIARVLSSACVSRTRCTAYGFRCVAYWSGRFDQLFSYTNHALCDEGWRWILWDGG